MHKVKDQTFLSQELSSTETSNEYKPTSTEHHISAAQVLNLGLTDCEHSSYETRQPLPADLHIFSPNNQLVI